MHNLLHVYSFFLTFGPLKAGFQKISGIGESMEPEYIYEGGQCRPYLYRALKIRRAELHLKRSRLLKSFLSKTDLQQVVVYPCRAV